MQNHKLSLFIGYFCFVLFLYKVRLFGEVFLCMYLHETALFVIALLAPHGHCYTTFMRECMMGELHVKLLNFCLEHCRYCEYCN